MTKKEIAEIIMDFTTLQELSLIPTTTETEVFQEIGLMDKCHEKHKYYFNNIDGLICNIGSDLKSKNLLNYAVSRLQKKISSNPDNKFFYDISNCMLCIAEIECSRPYLISDLVNTKRFNEARKQFIAVKQDEYSYYERALTNSANILEKYGRNFEAIVLYDEVLKKHPNFGMALGNKALAIDYYIRLTPQKSFKLMRKEVELLKMALNDSSIDEIGGCNARAAFEKRYNEIRDYLKSHNQLDIIETVGRMKFTEYENFILDHNIILNYDFGYYYDRYSLQDNLFPSFVESVNDEKYEKNNIMSEHVYFAFQVFNQIIESYTSSRILFFESLSKKYIKHDKRVGYVYTFDYTIHGVKYGFLKSIFCDLYNCLDKIAHLITFYYVKDKSGLPRNIYFEWLQSDDFSKIIIEENSFQLLALRNLSLDFEEGYQYHYLRKIRNRITHSFLNINEGLGYSEKFIDYEITEEMLIENVLSMFLIVKAAIMYFTIAVRLTKPSEVAFPIHATLEKDIYF